jgi:hypothetical protein
MSSKSQAYENGWDDYMNFSSPENPYEEGTEEYDDWEEGWEAASIYVYGDD